MADFFISQSEADILLKMKKQSATEDEHEFPQAGERMEIPLLSINMREKFILDLSRRQIDRIKITYQNRAKQIVVLARLDIGGSPHRNPDGEEISCPHLHIYREGYHDKYAYELPPELFDNPSDPWQMLHDFMKFCNIVKPPTFTKGLLYD
ncbi:MAG: hypothetical protein K8R90_04350 [Candidatus Cloacimonetes bacterium]|nr:hypothetical protein [Candidatus Cloacimonadota bacterium]